MPQPGETFALLDVGCKVNQYDGQVMREHLRKLGWREVSFREPADLYVINTCTVTARADEKCRKEVQRAIRRNPGARVIVTGCGAVRGGDIFAAIPGVSAVFSREQMARVDEFLATGAAPEPGDIFACGISRFAGHTRAFLKLQDGCDAHCAYCIVPYVRGRERSRPLQDVREEAGRLVAAGHIEIVLTGIHVGRYHSEDGNCLADAARKLLELPGLQRLRVSSLEAMEVSDALLDIAAADGRFCPHFHLPLQSGDDNVLAAMRRTYTVAEFLGKVKTIRERFNRPALTTDVMIGFPGETDAQFEQTLEVCRQAGFSRIHVFPYSPRKGTPAAAMRAQVARAVIRERTARMEQLAAELALNYKQMFLGEMVLPLVEHRCGRGPGLLTGWTPRYLRVEFAGPDALRGTIAGVRVKEVTPKKVAGVLPDN